ncbi:SpoIIE family protein phosphatase [Saccharothrix yanglingensis]|uniref:PAS domain S-box protein n=1 Tax=Saccharothrix yanglingensis TaxID=659496 RepID=A0ABU0X9G4_9PSEU|nr:SpoIIE family protein phosphatase [Saccharothrix yanglingensis]MDQ2588242.1 PAS domain S-box protein [Saccharothrix yanglingensis]
MELLPLPAAGDPAAVVACFEALPAAVWGFAGPDLVVVAANFAARAVVGDLPDPVGRPAREGLPEAVGRQLLDLVGQCYSRGRVVVGEERRVPAGRNQGFATITCVPALDAGGAVSGVVAHVVDATAQVLAREQAERRHRAAREAVHDVQRALLPEALPVLPRLRLAARHVAAADERAAGGDWFDAVPLGDGRVALLVGDVVGHGPGATAAMAGLRAVALHALWSGAPVEAVAAQLDAFAARSRPARAAAVCLVELDTGTGEVRGVNRAHPPALVVSADGGTRFLARDRPGGPLGVGAPDSGAWHDRLRADDVLVLYSDGLVEREGRPLGAGLTALAEVTASALTAADGGAAPPHHAADRLCAAAVDRMGWPGHGDDVTVLVAERLPEAPAPLSVTLDCDPANLSVLRRRLADWLAVPDVDEDTAYAIQHSAGEAVTNSVEHAYARGGGEVRVTARLTDLGAAEIAVHDRGRWRTAPESPGGRGRGLALMRHFADTVDVTSSDGGTTVRLLVPITRPAHVDRVGPHVARARSGFGTVLERSANPVLTVTGPVDAHTADALRVAVHEAGRGGALPLVVDLTGVTLLSGAGVRLLYELTAALRVRLVAPGGSPAGQVLSLTGLAHAERLD